MVEHARAERQPAMSPFQIARLAAVVTAAAVLFGLGQGLGLALYVAIPAAFVAYAAVLVGLGFLLKAEPPQRR